GDKGPGRPPAPGRRRAPASDDPPGPGDFPESLEAYGTRVQSPANRATSNGRWAPRLIAGIAPTAGSVRRGPRPAGFAPGPGPHLGGPSISRYAPGESDNCRRRLRPGLAGRRPLPGGAPRMVRAPGTIPSGPAPGSDPKTLFVACYSARGAGIPGIPRHR